MQESNRAAQPDKRLVEAYFVFACVWAFGGTMLVDKSSDYRAQFSKWWIQEWKAVPFLKGCGGCQSPIVYFIVLPAC